MKKVMMLEYQGRCDTQGKAVGHAPKVLAEYYRFIEKYCDVTVCAPRVILQELPKDIRKGSKVLRKDIVMKGHNSLYEKIANKKHMFDNLKAALRASDADIIWLFNVEYYLILYLVLHKKPRQKLICTLFLEKFSGGGMVGKVKKKVFDMAQKKMDLIISTGEGFRFPNCETVYIPDYYYVPEKYDAYRALTKKPEAVCLGTMGDGKQLEEMVEAFNRIGYPLTIAGRFYDKDRLERLKASAGGNITIRDEYLSEKEYLTLLASAQYSVLPYAPEQYSRQTSGVLQEAVFLNTVPVTYEAILEGNGISGVGFQDWGRLQLPETEDGVKEYRKEYGRLRDGKYSMDAVSAKYSEIFG